MTIPPLSTPESDWFALLRATRVINAVSDSLAALVGIAAHCIARGETQEGADILAWVLRQDNLSEGIRDSAQELWDELDSRICPRVLLDAAEFATHATFDDLYEYVMLPL